jgi:HK97 family phage major capsid protein
MKDILKKTIARLQTQIADLNKRADESTSAEEIDKLSDEKRSLKVELEEAEAELAKLEREERAKKDMVPEDAKLVNGNVRGTFKTAETRDDEDFTSTLEYRKAFKKYVQSEGTDMPAELRAGDVTSTADTGAAIPMTVMNEVINTVRKRYGNLYSKVTKTAIQGGVEVPVGSLQATFKWIKEGTVSPRQKAGELEPISFKYNTAEIRVAQSFLSQIVTLSAFEAKLTEIIAIAYLQAMDYGIINGSGKGSMLGILNDPRVTNTITMTAAEINNWTKWRTKFFKNLPLGYRSGSFIFPVSTVDEYLETMADSNNNPVFRQTADLVVNDGDAINPNGRFFGREISLVEPDIIADFDSASAGDVIGIYWQPEEYAINENFGFTMRRYFDEETNEWVDKALVVVDGKTVNPTGFYKIIKG